LVKSFNFALFLEFDFVILDIINDIKYFFLNILINPINLLTILK